MTEWNYASGLIQKPIFRTSSIMASRSKKCVKFWVGSEKNSRGAMVRGYSSARDGPHRMTAVRMCSLWPKPGPVIAKILVEDEPATWRTTLPGPDREYDLQPRISSPVNVALPLPNSSTSMPIR